LLQKVMIWFFLYRNTRQLVGGWHRCAAATSRLCSDGEKATVRSVPR